MTRPPASRECQGFLDLGRERGRNRNPRSAWIGSCGRGGAHRWRRIRATKTSAAGRCPRRTLCVTYANRVSQPDDRHGATRSDTARAKAARLPGVTHSPGTDPPLRSSLAPHRLSASWRPERRRGRLRRDPVASDPEQVVRACSGRANVLQDPGMPFRLRNGIGLGESGGPRSRRERTRVSSRVGRIPQLALRFAIEYVPTQSTSCAASAATLPGRHHGAAGRNGRDVPCPGHIRRADRGRFDEPLQPNPAWSVDLGARQGSPPCGERRNRTRAPVDPHADDAMDRDTYGGRINSAANRTTDMPDWAARQVPKLFGGRWNRSGRAAGDG